MSDGRPAAASGVQELIARLHREGLDAGRQEASRLLDEARVRADEILKSAHKEAAETVRAARAAAAAERKAMREALRLAQRDSVLALKEELATLLRDRLFAAMQAHLRTPDGLQAVLIAALNALPPGEHASAELLADAETEKLLHGALGHLLEQLLARGILLRAGVSHAAGLRLRLNGQGIELDMTDEALTELLTARLLARFHMLLEEREP